MQVRILNSLSYFCFWQLLLESFQSQNHTVVLWTRVVSWMPRAFLILEWSWERLLPILHVQGSPLCSQLLLQWTQHFTVLSCAVSLLIKVEVAVTPARTTTGCAE